MRMGDREGAVEVWERCFQVVYSPFIDRSPPALELILQYSMFVVGSGFPQVHSSEARLAFAAAAKYGEQVCSNEFVARCAQWLRTNAHSPQ